MYGVTFGLCSKVCFRGSKSRKIMMKTEAKSVLKCEHSSHACGVSGIEGFMLSHLQSIIICCIIYKISLYWLVITIFVLNTLFWRIARNISPRTWTRSIWAPNYVNVRVRKVVTKLDFMETESKSLGALIRWVVNVGWIRCCINSIKSTKK